MLEGEDAMALSVPGKGALVHVRGVATGDLQRPVRAGAVMDNDDLRVQPVERAEATLHNRLLVVNDQTGREQRGVGALHLVSIVPGISSAGRGRRTTRATRSRGAGTRGAVGALPASL